MMDEIDLVLTDNIAEVGGRIRGEARRPAQPADSRDPVRAVRLSLYYWTEGRGDEDRQVVSSVEVPAAANGSIDTRFELIVPDLGPISYDGRLMRVAWAVEARLDMKLRRDTKQFTTVLIVPRGGLDMYDRPHPLRLV